MEKHMTRDHERRRNWRFKKLKIKGDLLTFEKGYRYSKCTAWFAEMNINNNN